MDMKRTIGKFIDFGPAVSIDVARKLLRILPATDDEKVVEFDAEGAPEVEDLDARLISY